MTVRPVRPPVDAAAAFRALFGGDGWAFWLDSARAEPGLARFSYLGSPGPAGEVLTYAVGQGYVDVRSGGAGRREPGTVLEALARRVDRPVEAPPGVPFELVDGWVGCLGYEVKADLGFSAAHRSAVPDAVWVQARRLLVLDHESDRAWLVAHGVGAQEWVAEAERVLGRLAREPGLSPGEGGWSPSEGAWSLVRDEVTYRRDVEACREALRRGESWELCLTDLVTGPAPADPFAAYLALRQHNPAPHAAYLRLGDTHVLSASPELFLHCSRDGVVSTKPIKGTAARHTDEDEDARAARELAADPKTVAENLIIVDLLRNDLSRVCAPGSVHVPALMAVESYATVHQLVTTVRGRLAPGRTVVDAVAACFPPGSMTGAPKHRTVEILDGLETRARGIYSGALGFVDRSGAADLSVVIRTAVVAEGRATVGAGGAVVLDSDPDAETAEMLLKAAAVVPGWARACGPPP